VKCCMDIEDVHVARILILIFINIWENCRLLKLAIFEKWEYIFSLGYINCPAISSFLYVHLSVCLDFFTYCDQSVHPSIQNEGQGQTGQWNNTDYRIIWQPFAWKTFDLVHWNIVIRIWPLLILRSCG
jgi:hypothetical protein